MLPVALTMPADTTLPLVTLPLADSDTNEFETDVLTFQDVSDVLYVYVIPLMLACWPFVGFDGKAIYVLPTATSIVPTSSESYTSNDLPIIHPGVQDARSSAIATPGIAPATSRSPLRIFPTT